MLDFITVAAIIVVALLLIKSILVNKKIKK